MPPASSSTAATTRASTSPAATSPAATPTASAPLAPTCVGSTELQPAGTTPGAQRHLPCAHISAADQRQRKPERGASVVEAALVLPLFMLLVVGMIEGGSLFFNVNSARNAARESAREAATWASDALADRNALGLATRGLTGSGRRLNGIVIYKASGPNDPVPAACKADLTAGTAGQVGLCNVYTAAKIRTLDDIHFGATATTPPGLWDEKWPPTSRNDALTPTSQPDFVGVYVSIQHEGITGIFPSRTVTSVSVSKIEPQRTSE